MKKVKLYNLFLIGGLFGIGMTILLMLIILNNKIQKVDIQNENVYTYIGTEKFELKGSLYYDNENKEVKFQTDSESMIISSVPLYFNDSQSLLLPREMSNVNYYSGNQNKVPRFSKIIYENSDYYYVFNNEKGKINNSFLYDGKDLYLFPESVLLKTNELELYLSPLSFVEYNYSNKKMVVYNYQDKEIKEYENVLDADVIIDNVKVKLKSDTIESQDISKILIKNFNNLKTIRMEW